MYKHILLTRYNGGKPDKEWNEHRIKIFKEMCLPSVVRQSNQNFDWRLFVDERTQEDIKVELRKILPANGRILWVSDEKRWFSEYQLALNSHWYESVLTTQLDNDDAISPNYIELIQVTANRYIYTKKDVDKLVLNATRWLELNYNTGEQRIYNWQMEDDFRRWVSPFFSLYESAPPFVGVYGQEHRNRSKTQYPVIDLNSHRPLYTRVIHWNNVSNQMEWSFIVKIWNNG